MSENDEPRGPLHVLLATNATEGGGAQQSNLTLATGLVELGLRVTILTVRPADPTTVASLPQAITVVDLREADWPRWTRAPSVLLKSLRVIRTRRVDVVISGSFGLNYILLTARLLRILRQPLIVIEHLGIHFRLGVLANGKRLLRNLFQAVLAYLYRHADQIVAVSRGVATEFANTLRLEHETIDVVHNGVDLAGIAALARMRPESAFTPAFDQLAHPRIITVGRLEPQKAQHDLIRAFAQVHATRGGSLTILGEGSLRDEMWALVTKFDLQESVHMPGYISPPYWYIAQSDVFVLSSIAEGFGLVLVEALACGTPVVSTDCPSGPHEILADPRLGWLTPASDPDSLAVTIVDCLTSSMPTVRQSELERFSHMNPPKKIAAIITKLVHQ